MKKMIILNHKMNLLYDDVMEYIVNLNNINIDKNIIVCPSYLYLESFINYCNWGIGSQDAFLEISGNYTSKVSLSQLKSLGVEYVILGHKEVNDSDEIINKKIIASLETNIVPIVCLNDDGKTVEELYESFNKRFANIDNYEFIILAYENLKEENLTIIESKIKTLKNMIKNNSSKEINVVYGGNVNKNNINEIINNKLIDGVMLGSISSSIKDVEEILNSVN